MAEKAIKFLYQYGIVLQHGILLQFRVVNSVVYVG